MWRLIACAEPRRRARSTGPGDGLIEPRGAQRPEGPEGGGAWWCRPWVVFLIAVLVTRGLGLIHPLLSADEATYATLATRILEGGLPYVAAVDHKPVGTELTYAAVFAIVGRNRLLFVRLVCFAVVVLTGLVLCWIGERLRNRRSGRVAGLAYALASAWGFPGDMQSANAELFLNLPLVLAAAAMLPTVLSERRHEAARMLAVGALTAVAATYKYQAIIAVLAWTISSYMADGTMAERCRRVGLVAAGFAAVAGAYVAHFVLTGTLDAFLFWGWGYNFSYINALPLTLQVENGAVYTAIVAAFWLPLLAGVQVPRRATARLALPWLGTMLVAVAAGGRFFPHYYLLVLPPLGLMLFCGEVRPARWRRVLAAASAVVSTAVSLALTVEWDRIHPGIREFAKPQRAVAAFISARSTIADRIFVWGSSPEIYYLADRVMGTRFPFCNYHTGKIWGTPQAERGATATEALIVPRAWAELLTDLDAAPPRFIIDGAAGGLDFFDGHAVDRYAELARRIHARYRLVGMPGGVPVYRLAD
jgi:hypothetical protein